MAAVVSARSGYDLAYVCKGLQGDGEATAGGITSTPPSRASTSANAMTSAAAYARARVMRCDAEPADRRAEPAGGGEDKRNPGAHPDGQQAGGHPARMP